MKVFMPLISTGGSMRCKFFRSLMEAVRVLGEEGVAIDWAQYDHGVYVNAARNLAASQFLREKELGEKLVFVDLDMVFSPGDMRRLVQSEHEVVGGLYYLKRQEERQACAVLMEPVKEGVPPGTVLEVKRAGTGFMKIERGVFEKLAGVAQGYVDYEGNPARNFFPIGVVGEELHPEDWGFCDMARGAGIKVMLDTGIQLYHEGSALYPL